MKTKAICTKECYNQIYMFNELYLGGTPCIENKIYSVETGKSGRLIIESYTVNRIDTEEENPNIYYNSFLVYEENDESKILGFYDRNNFIILSDGVIKMMYS